MAKKITVFTGRLLDMFLNTLFSENVQQMEGSKGSEL